MSLVGSGRGQGPGGRTPARVLAEACQQLWQADTDLLASVQLHLIRIVSKEHIANAIKVIHEES